MLAALAAVGCRRDADYYMKRGDQNLKNKNYQDAALDYRKALQRNPRSGNSYFGLAQAEIERKNFVEALQALNKAAEFLPDRVDVQVKLADLTLAAYQSNPRNEGLYASLKRVTALLAKDPNSFDALRMKGNLALLDGKPAEALEAFRRAHEIQPWHEYLVMGYTEALIQSGQIQQAEQLARQLIERKKDFGPIYDVLYRYYVSSGRTSEGEDVLQTRIRNNPAESSPAIQLAAHYRQVQKPAAMRTVLDQLMSDYSKHPDAFLLTGDFYARSGEWTEAVAAYGRGAKTFPADANKYQKRIASLYLAQNNPTDALKTIEEVLVKAPTDSEALALQADILVQRSGPGDLDKAIATYQSVLKDRPNNPHLILSLGRAHVAKNNLGPARKLLLQVVKDPTVADPARLLLTSISLLELKPSEALVFVDEVLRTSPNNARARYLKVAAQMQLSHLDEARADLDKLVRDFPQAKDLRILQGLLAVRSKRYKDAEAIFARISAEGSDVRATTGLAEAYVAQEQFDKALKMLEAEAKGAPPQAAIRRVLARTAIEAGQYDRAITELQLMLQGQPDSAQILDDLGEAYRAKGNLSEATQKFQKAVAISPKLESSHLHLGYTLQQSGNTGEAIRSYRQALALQPNDSLAMNNLAYALAETADAKGLDEAQQLVQRALQISPREPDFLDTLGWIWLKKGKPDEAVPIFSALCREVPRNASYHHHLGIALLAARNTAGATKAFEMALANAPSPSEAAEIRTALKQAASAQ